MHWQAHHANGNPNDHRVAHCVCLCADKEGQCHLEAHNGNYNGTTVIPNNDYKWWNG